MTVRKNVLDLMVKARLRSLMVISMFLLGITTFSPFMLVDARPEYADDLPSVFGGSCRVCHLSASGGGKLNDFGKDFEENKNIFEGIEEKDSDSDGFSNADELKAGTLPGDPDSNSKKGIPGFPYESILLGIAILIPTTGFSSS